MKTRTETEKQKRKGDELPKAKKGGTRRQKAGAAPVELHGALGLEGQPQPHQQVGEALLTNMTDQFHLNRIRIGLSSD